MSLSISSSKGAIVVFDSARPAGSRVVCSLPARLNNMSIPALSDLRDIVEGRTIRNVESIAQSIRVRFDRCAWRVKFQTRETVMQAMIHSERLYVVTFHDGAWLKVKASGDIGEAARQIESLYGAWASIVSDATTLGGIQSSQGVA